jgi:hypothetical protein|tara:strand:+ start:218 stop:601 length:384 start_codon:yes stop_codon:yes gene_type:complete
MEQNSINLNFEDWKIKTLERTKNRMKINIKLSKDEAQAFKNFMEMVKPPEIPEDDFLRGIFKIGVETMEERLLEAVKEHAEANNVDLSGVSEFLDEEEEPEDIVVPVVGEVSKLKSPNKDTDEVQDR